MRLSQSTIVSPIPGREKLLLVQPLTGQVALLESEQANAVRELAPEAELPRSLPLEALAEGGFAVESADGERRLLAQAWVEYLGELEKTPTQLIVVPNFGCNLKCTYCFQELFDPAAGLIKPENIEALFAYIDRFHGNDSPRPYLTLFGGEPLVDTPAHHDRVRRLLDGARQSGMSVAAVTNGYDLESFLPDLAQGPIKEIQVTIDGPQSIHDSRRPHANGQGTFERVVRSIDLLLAAKIPVNLRVVADKDNLPAMPALARVADEKGWLSQPESLFKTQIGRNYELFGCAQRQKREQLYDRIELWSRYVELAEADPVLRRFHKPRMHGMRHLAETGEFPAPNFDSCPAAKKEWAFAADGNIYGCTATVGNPRYRLGRYAPTIERDEKAIEAWAGRSVHTIDQCKSCAVAAVCGGGCGAIAAHNNNGDPRTPDCRPVREIIGLGARFYGLDRD